MALPPPSELQRQLIAFAESRQRSRADDDAGSVSSAATSAFTRSTGPQLGSRWRRNLGPIGYTPMGTSQIDAADDWQRPRRIAQRDEKAVKQHSVRNRFARRGPAEVAVFAGERAIFHWNRFQQKKVQRAERVHRHMMGATLGGYDPNASTYSRAPTGEPGTGARQDRRRRRASNLALRNVEEIEKLVTMKY